MIEVKNARITRTMLGIEDHGIFTFMLTLDYGGTGQGAGGYALDEYKGELGERVGTGYGIDIIKEIMKVLGVDKWEDLKGQLIRAKTEHSKVHAIGHVLRDDWLDFQKFSNKYRETAR